MKHILSVSGGKDSTAMLLYMIEQKYHIDEIIYCDTGKDFPEIHDTIDRLQQYIDRPITTLRHPKGWDYLMFDHIKTRGQHKGEKGYGWPHATRRWCTKHLKTELIDSHLDRKYGLSECVQYIGYAHDEIQRIEKNRPRFVYPLALAKMSESQALRFCYDRGFDFGGLYNHFDRVSCWCCPLQSVKELWKLYTHFSQKWEELHDMDIRQPYPFKDGKSVSDLTRRFDALTDKIAAQGAGR